MVDLGGRGGRREGEARHLGEFINKGNTLMHSGRLGGDERRGPVRGMKGGRGEGNTRKGEGRKDARRGERHRLEGRGGEEESVKNPGGIRRKG